MSLKVELASASEGSNVLTENTVLAMQERSKTTSTRVKSLFARHVMLFGSANLLALVANGILTFLLPRWLTIEGYGYYRIFILYGGFVGLLHFGLIEGALIRWAARPQSRLRADLASSAVFLLLGHAVLLTPTVVVVVDLYPSRRWLAIALAFYAVVWNWSMLGQYALQSAKRFSLLSMVTVANPTLLLVSILLLQRWGRLTISSLIAAFVLSVGVSGACGWFALRHELNMASLCRRRVWMSAMFHVRLGSGVLLANVFTGLTIALDRIVVSSTFPIRDFAIYAFAANALAVVNTIILSVARVAFPYLSDGISPETRVRAYEWGEAGLVGLWAISLTGYFSLYWLITRLLPNYIPSLPVLRLLMLGTGLTAIIHILQCNFFRSTFRLAQLLVGCTLGLICALVLLTLARHTNKLSMMALAMLGSIAMWWMFNELLLKPLTGRSLWHLARIVLAYSTCALWFWFCSSWSNLTAGACAYLFVAVILVCAFYFPIFRSIPDMRLFEYPRVRVAVPE